MIPKIHTEKKLEQMQKQLDNLLNKDYSNNELTL